MKLPKGRGVRVLACVAALGALAATAVPALAEGGRAPAAAATAGSGGRRVVGEIVGGRKSATDAYPWMAALYLDKKFHCGAVLVAPSWVLTAAHCAAGRDASRLSVLIGRADRTGRGGEWRTVTTVQRHPKFERDAGGELQYDVALIELDRPSTEQPLRLASSRHRALWKPGSTVRALGWGTTSEKSRTRVTKLREVDVPVQRDSTMSRAYGARFSATTMLGAGPWKGGRDTCSGDSGGPLMAATRTSWWLVGVTSWGDGCARPGKPGIYARAAGNPLAAFIWSLVE